MAKARIPRDRKADIKAEMGTRVRAEASAPPGIRKGTDRDSILRRTLADRDARTLYDRAPQLGSESLECLHRLAWAELSQIRRHIREQLIELRHTANEVEDPAMRAGLQAQGIRLGQLSVKVLKDLAGLLLGVNKVHLGADLDKAFAEITITTDQWRDQMKTTAPPPPPPLDDEDEPSVH